MRICTIVARNYLAYARILAESFAEHHPDGRCSVLVIDDRGMEVDESVEPFDVIRPADLNLDRFEGMAAMYDVTELATAVKPWLLEHLLDQDERPIAYFDPDIRFYASVEKIEALATEHGIVLTPHITAPIPDDDKQPGEIDLMASGTYNLGFLALSPCERTRELLGWWQRRLRYDCVIDHALGYFVDQRWFDLVPNTFGPAAIMRDAGMNVAYWNLHERTVRRDLDGGWLVNEEPLRFYHFSGFDPKRPHLLSKHQTRTLLSENRQLAALCKGYADEVQAHRRADENNLAYAWDELADGRRWDRRLRRLYRDGERTGAFSFSPFEPDGADEFLTWLNGSAEDGGDPRVTRFWLQVYRERSDLQFAFPDLGGQYEAFSHWTRTEGRELAELSGVGVLDDSGKAGESDRSQQEPWGVNVAGFLQSELGIGEAARSLISALDAARVPLLPIHGHWRPNSRQEHPYAMLETEDALFPINVVCVNADVMSTWAAEAGEDFFRNRYTIGFWWWEVTNFPTEWMRVFDLVDEVWVASEHVAEALLPIAPVPITKVPMPVTAPSFRPRSRVELALPDDFLFLFLFDHHSIFERKNPIAVIEAFKRAFPPGSGRSLVIKSINHAYHPDAHERMLLAAATHPDVHIVDRYVSANDKNAMIASADCYVSLHRAEGYGLTLAEALRMGRPVIGTRYGGNLDFMNDRNSWLVDFDPIRVGEGNYPYPADAEWADADVDQAARFMQEIAADPERAAARARLGAAEMAELHSPHGAGRIMRRRLESIYERRRDWPRRPARQRTFSELDGVASLVGVGGLDGRQRGRARALLRRAALRMMKPFTAYQHSVDHAMLSAIRQLADATARQAEDQRRQHATQAVDYLGALRRHETQLEHALRELQRIELEAGCVSDDVPAAAPPAADGTMTEEPGGSGISASNGNGDAHRDRRAHTMSTTDDEQRHEHRPFG